MKENEKKSSKNEKNIQKGIDKPKRMLYNKHIYFILSENKFLFVAPGDEARKLPLGAKQVFKIFLLFQERTNYIVYLLSVKCLV